MPENPLYSGIVGVARSCAIVHLSEGTTIADRYQIVRLLGSGGMGFVYEVSHVATGHRYALKTIRNDDPRSSPVLIKQLLDESKATARIKSEHIVKITDGGVDAASSVPFLVMELLEGTNLAAELARRGRLPPVEVIRLIYQASLALEKTHAAGVVHRDLKPENLFLITRDDGSSALKILDFGIAKIVDSSTNAGTTRNFGTPLYMSPEQYRGDGNIDHRADLYALAQITFLLLTGHPYWDADSRTGPYALMCRVVEGTTEAATRRAHRWGASLPASFDPWFSKATATEPYRRFDAAIDMASALAVALGLSPPRPEASAPPRRRAMPARKRAFAGLVILFFAGGGVATALITRATDRAAAPAPPEILPVRRPVLSVDVAPAAVRFESPAQSSPEPSPESSPPPAETARDRRDRAPPDASKRTSPKRTSTTVKIKAINRW
jgi:serine/threonine-protein kinase